MVLFCEIFIRVLTVPIRLEIFQLGFQVNSSQEEAFQSVMQFFDGRHDKILSSSSPTLVRAEFGELISMIAVSNAKGEAEVSIMKKEEGSYVNFNFNFKKFYVANIMVIVTMGLIAFGAYYWITGIVLSNFSPEVFGDTMATFYPLTILLFVLYFIFSISIEVYSVRRTRKKFLKEFRMFLNH